MTNTDKRLIEYYIPIKAISAEASREKSIRHGHISTLHLWWARRPLVASRAAVFAALVPWDAQPKLTERDPISGEEKPMTLNKFMIELRKWEVRDEVLEKPAV
jgi:putative DNA methylase